MPLAPPLLVPSALFSHDQSGHPPGLRCDDGEKEIRRRFPPTAEEADDHRHEHKAHDAPRTGVQAGHAGVHAS